MASAYFAPIGDIGRKMKEDNLTCTLEDMDRMQGERHVDDPNPQEGLAPSQHLHWPTDAGVDDLSYMDFHNLASSVPNSPPSLAMMNNIMSYDASGQPSSSAWPHADPVMAMTLTTTTENPMPPHSYPSLPVSRCNCNSTTGPCAGHLEQIRSHILGGAASPPHIQQQQRGDCQVGSDVDPRAESGPLPTPGGRYNAANHGESKQRPQLLAHHEATSSSSSSKTRTRPSGDSSPRAGGTSSATEPATSSSSSAASSSGDVSAVSKRSTDTQDVTERFETLLDAMRAAGFQDFDQMAVAYYTGQFTTNSLPAISQCASRSRRLKTVLQALQECSGQWPRRESRGLYEGLLDTATSLCVQEIDRVNKSMSPDLLPVEPGNFLSTLGWLLFNNHDENEMDSDREVFKGRNGHRLEEIRKLAEQMETYQDSMLHLWPLLTELAGPQGLYCDKMAQVVLVVLLYARVLQ
ncbi:uncharacterized protein Z518_03337 [Rhinocladiella mackenziei CBS 650.93]|uniref:Uncharacterized protein n=1 Tax=Rhinocladiella mackenziei CBS 650.93 TaxID=1442369 RepID=A0A0D2JH36_9EURO|nr:uncharacterized protein Z518_03337 [Rhinocladiella mackenziei CBS 650.93]KIX08680.1 hypothetical protein Z518_03337 [Rhinocladiella mackenziei CBS 650.93]